MSYNTQDYLAINIKILGSVMTKKYTISSEKKSNQDIMSSMYLSVMLAQPESKQCRYKII